MHLECSGPLWTAHRLPGELWPSWPSLGSPERDTDSQERGCCGQHLGLRGGSQGLTMLSLNARLLLSKT